MILTLDGDDPNGPYADINNFPDSPLDNHQKYGWNIGFADGHADWVTPYGTWRVLHQSDMAASHVPPQYRPRQ